MDYEDYEVIIFIAVLAVQIAWLATFIEVVKRKDWSNTDQIIWITVLCVLNIVGAMLYALFSPSYPAREPKDKT